MKSQERILIVSTAFITCTNTLSVTHFLPCVIRLSCSILFLLWELLNYFQNFHCNNKALDNYYCVEVENGGFGSR